MKVQLNHKFKDIISLNNLLSAWEEFIIGKKMKEDVQYFFRDLMDNILALHKDLTNNTYQHGGYTDFYITDPKRRHIHKALVRDRLLHHAIYRLLYPFFDKIFIADSFSCRKNKGTHKAINRFRAMTYKIGRNNTHACWILKCDVRKFFDSIDHKILLNILAEYIPDKGIMWLLEDVIKSYSKTTEINVGLPLGNLTSQLFANIYMNVFDQFVKHKLKVKYYIRYADDFVFLSDNKDWLINIRNLVSDFLNQRLRLSLHKNKVYISTISSGVDFLGWVNFSNHRILRKKTKERMLKRIQENPTNETLQSYLGLIKHGNSFKIKEEVLNEYWLWEKSNNKLAVY